MGQNKIATKESYIERKVCEYAQKKGWLTYKFSSPGNRGVPDRILMKNGYIFFIEFKAPGKDLTEFQYHTHIKFKVNGIVVYVIDNIDKGKNLLDSYKF